MAKDLKKHESYVDVIKKGKLKTPETPEEIWDDAVYYFQWADDNPIVKLQPITSGVRAGEQVENVYPRPYSLKAFCLWSGISELMIRMWRDMKDEKNGYFVVVNKILSVIYLQNSEMTLIGVYNPSFIRDAINQTQERDTVCRIEIVDGLPKLGTSEIEILKSIEIEKGEVKMTG